MSQSQLFKENIRRRLFPTNPRSCYHLPHSISPQLADLVGSKEGERLTIQEIILRIWEYIMQNDCLNKENKLLIIPRGKMVPVFGEEIFEGFGMANLFKSHIL